MPLWTATANAARSGDLRLAEADVTADEAAIGSRRLEVFHHQTRSPAATVITQRPGQLDAGLPGTRAARRGWRQRRQAAGHRRIELVLPDLGGSTRLDPAQEVLGAKRLASVREGDDDAPARAHERRNSTRLRRDRRTRSPVLRLEANGWVCGNGSSSVRPASEGGSRMPSSSQTRRTASGWKTKSGGRPSGGTRSSGTARRRLLVPLRDKDCSGSTSVASALGRRVQRRLCDRMERALREGRERAHRLDLVAEELDAERLAAGRREDVDDAAPHRELAAIVHPLDALVARERERLREASTPGSSPGRSSIGSGRASAGGSPSASARADAQTSPPCASTWSARARSPTRCGGGASPDSHVTPGSAAGRPRRRRGTSSGLGGVARRPRPPAGARPSRAPRAGGASRAGSGRADSDTRARVGSASANSPRRSCSTSSRTNA